MLDCNICYEPFDRENVLPKVIHCATRICQVCLQKTLETTGLCPFDKTFLADRNVENYQTDDMLLLIIDMKRSQQSGGLETQRAHSLDEKRKKKLQACEQKKNAALQIIEEVQENMHKEEEDVHDWACRGLEMTQKKLKVQACYRQDLNRIHQDFSNQSSSKLNFQIDDFLQNLAGELQILKESYIAGLKNLVLNSPSLLRQKMETVSQLIQIIKKDDFIGIMPKEFGTGCADILKEIEVWKNTKKVVLFFKKDRINKEILQAMAAVFEEFVNVTDVKLDLGNESLTNEELSLLFERQFWQKPTVCKFELDMQNSKTSGTALAAALTKITTKMPELISLNLWLQGTKLSNEGLKALGEYTLGSLHHLQHFGLSISDCAEMTDTGLSLLVPHMVQSLRNSPSLLLVLDNNPQVSNETLVFTLKNLFGSGMKLETLHLSLAGTKLNDDGLSQISSVLKGSLQNARNFSLLLNRTEITDLGAQYFINTVLTKLPNAQSLALNFHKTKIGDPSMAALLDKITGFSTDLRWVTLNMTNTHVSDKGISQYNCKNFCSMRRIELFQFYTHEALTTLDALSEFRLRLQKDVERSSKFQIL